MEKTFASPFAFLGLLMAGFAMLLFACSGPADGRVNHENGDTSTPAEFVTEVDAMVLETATFELELVSNGNLHALRKTRISFPFSETLLSLHVNNGDRVKEGQLLATLCRENLQRRKQQARLRFARASLDMEDILLGRGFTIGDSLKIPPEVWQMAGVRSGYSEAALELQNLKADLQRTRITAPFAGVVAGLEVQSLEQVNAGEVLCQLIDNTAFLARFPVMENELPRVSPGTEVAVVPFATPQSSRKGSVQNINPQVDEHGRVEVTALIADTRGLMEGMNVRVRVKSPVPQQLVVPRSAVLYRDNLEVLFKYAAGKAEWTYVNVLHENTTHFSVMANPDRVASLQQGDTVIVSGNMNLSHGSLVNINPR